MNEDGTLIIKTEIDNSGVDDGIEEIKDIIDDEDIEIKPDFDTKDIDKKTNDLGKNISKVLGKSFGSVGKMVGIIVQGLGAGLLVALAAALGVILLIAAAFAKLNTENEKINEEWTQIKNTMSNALSQIGTAIANIFLPVIEKILSFLKTMIQYLGYVLKAWFGIDIFAKSTSKSLKNGVNSAKQLNKQLAGFDEMNILQDNSSGGSGGADIGMIEPLPEGEVPKWLKWIADNGEKVRDILLLIAAAVGAVMLALNLTNPLGWALLIIGALGLILSYWDEIKEFFLKIADWVKQNVIDPIVKYFTDFYNTLKGIFLPIIEFFQSIFTTIYENIVISLENIRSIFSFVWDKIKEIFGPVVDFFKEKFEQAREAIKEALSPVLDFISALWGQIKAKLFELGNSAGTIIGNGFKAAFNAIMQIIETFLNTPIKAINKLIDVINEVPGINLGRLTTFKLPRLAKGTILNNPGKGVPVASGSALAGEAGREAYLPLSDTQLLEELGSTIGKYITINANITNTMNGRVIGRELKKINNETDFGFNR